MQYVMNRVRIKVKAIGSLTTQDSAVRGPRIAQDSALDSPPPGSENQSPGHTSKVGSHEHLEKTQIWDVRIWADCRTASIQG